MFKKRYIPMAAIGVTLSIMLGILVLWGYNFLPIPELFRLNRECQEEGYYMAEFEYKMLGFAYLLDNGHYVKAISGIRKLHQDLKSREGLIKVPKFTDKKQEVEFYLNLQNPRTGAFMGDSNPYCTYDGPTGNVLLHLEALAKETGQPLRLKYPLKYLDEISAPENLKAFLDDVSHVGWIASKLPQTSFHFARDLLNYCEEPSVLERNRLYVFSPEWKEALLEWFYENQDPETGFWGPKSRKSGKLLKLDLNNTASILKSFVDQNGKNIHGSFPLRYKREMFAAALQILSEPMPSENELDELHEWALVKGKGFKILTGYLWTDASRENKAETRRLIEDYVKIKFEKYYIENEGAFSYYPGSKQATLDGTGGAISLFENAGAFSPEKQKHLWGIPAKDLFDFQTNAVSKLTKNDFNPLLDHEDINSIRFYGAKPVHSDYTSNVAYMVYPKDTLYLDVVDLVPRINNWLDTTSQSMGN